MNQHQHQQMVKEAAKPKFRGRTKLTSKVVPKYPYSAEREFQRITNAYVRIINQTLKENLPEIMAAYKHERYDSYREDDFVDLERKLRQIFMKMAGQIEQKLAKFGLHDAVQKVAKNTQGNALREWKRCVRNTLGIDLMNDYYNGDFYEDAIRRWVDENVLKIQSIPTSTLGEMQQILMKGFRNGDTIRTITKNIQEEYNVTKSKARSLARDQVGTLSCQITKQQHQDAGVTKYKWSDSGDSRVRDCHHALDGQIFSWDDPPEMWYMTKSRGLVMTGRRCHPGQDFACRCCAIPVFDYDTLNIPINEKNGK